jgi:hypothetical protein
MLRINRIGAMRPHTISLSISPPDTSSSAKDNFFCREEVVLAFFTVVLQGKKLGRITGAGIFKRSLSVSIRL